MSTTSIQTVASTRFDPRDVATIIAALLCYQHIRGTPSLLTDEVHHAATADGQFVPLSHQEVSEMVDLLQVGDVLESHTLGHDWDETGNDIPIALGMHAAARVERDGDTVGVLLMPEPAHVRDAAESMNG